MTAPVAPRPNRLWAGQGVTELPEASSLSDRERGGVREKQPIFADRR
jgi:hypothetical protein